MAKRNGTISLWSFTQKSLAKFGWDEDQIHRFYIIGADGLRDLSIHSLPIAKTTTLTIDSDNLTSDFPDDFIDYVFIAIEKYGRWWTFTRDDTMVDKTITGITGDDLGDMATEWGFGARGGANDWYFTPDYENRRFLFNGVTTSDVVVMKYVSTGVEAITSVDATTDVEFPVYAERAMEDYMRWKWAEYNDFPSGECKRREDMYNESLLIMRNIHMPTLDEIYGRAQVIKL